MGVLPRGVLGTPPAGPLCWLSPPSRLTDLSAGDAVGQGPRDGPADGTRAQAPSCLGVRAEIGVGAAAAVGVPGSPSQPHSMHSEAIIRTAAGNFNPPFLWQPKCLEGSHNARKIHFKNVRATNRLLNTPRTPGLGRAWLCRLLELLRTAAEAMVTHCLVAGLDQPRSPWGMLHGGSPKQGQGASEVSSDQSDSHRGGDMPLHGPDVTPHALAPLGNSALSGSKTTGEE